MTGFNFSPLSVRYAAALAAALNAGAASAAAAAGYAR